MLIESLITSIIVGRIRGGKLKRLSYIRFNRVWIFILALFIQLSLVLITFSDLDFVLQYVKQLYIISYVLLFIGIILNIKYKSLWVILLGGILNLIPFVFNNGKIPISVDGLKLAGLNDLANIVNKGELVLYTSITGNTRFSFLADIITIPEPYPFPQILSIGDVIVAIGLFIFIQSIMLDRHLDRSSMIRFKYRSRI